MNKKRATITTEIEEYVRVRRRAGLSHRAIADELARAGTPVSLGAVHKIAPASAPLPAPAAPVPTKGRTKAPAPPARPAPPAPPARRGAKAAAPPAPEPPPRAPGALDLPPDDADMATLDGWIESTEKLARQAEADGNLQGFASLQRLLQSAFDRRRKMRPPPAPDPDANPDMVRAGEAAAARLHSIVDDALRAAGAPAA